MPPFSGRSSAALECLRRASESGVTVTVPLLRALETATAIAQGHHCAAKDSLAPALALAAQV